MNHPLFLINEFTPSPSVYAFIDKFSSDHFLPLVDLPTRITPFSSSCIDHIYINSLAPCKSGVLELLVSDHFAVFCSIPFPDCVVSLSKEVKFRNHSVENFNEFRRGVQTCIDNFFVYDEFEIEYRRYRNTLCNSIKMARDRYYKGKFDNCRNDPRATWKVINGVLRPNPGSSDIRLRDNDTLVENPNDVSNLLNVYFSTIAKDLSDRIPYRNIDPLLNVPRVLNTFVYYETDSSEICNLIKSFPSRQSHLNAIPSFVYKHVADIISPVLANLINLSVMKGYFPEFMKIARPSHF